MGAGLYEVFPDMTMIQPVREPGRHLIQSHGALETNQIFFGPYVIDAQRNIRAVEQLLDIRASAVECRVVRKNMKRCCHGMRRSQ